MENLKNFSLKANNQPRPLADVVKVKTSEDGTSRIIQYTPLNLELRSMKVFADWSDRAALGVDSSIDHSTDRTPVLVDEDKIKQLLQEAGANPEEFITVDDDLACLDDAYLLAMFSAMVGELISNQGRTLVLKDAVWNELHEEFISNAHEITQDRCRW